MKSKVFAIMVILSVAAISKAHGFGIGAQANFSAGGFFAPGAALLISPSDTTNFAINWFLGEGNVNVIGLTLDAVPLVLPISSGGAGTFNFTLGVGLYANAFFPKDSDNTFNCGLRIPIGFNLMMGRNVFEIFLHVAPSFGLEFVPSLSLSKPFFPIALGARIWFH